MSPDFCPWDGTSVTKDCPAMALPENRAEVVMGGSWVAYEQMYRSKPVV